MRRFRNVPPFQFLQGFEAAARLASFSRAAEELGLSQSAVSHQMRLLEERLGQNLFLRVGRSVRLTDAGRDYQRSVSYALEHLELGYRRLAPYRKPGSVVIYAPPDFGRRWLLPRLGDLVRSCPGCEPWLDLSGVPVDFGEMEASLAIVLAPVAPPGMEVIRIAADRRGPVASPALVGRAAIEPRDLARLPLVHSEGQPGWSEWLELAGAEAADVAAGLDFSDGDAAMTAAELGLGVALASLPLSEAAVRAGRLVAPVALAVDTSRAWLAVSTASELSDAFAAAVWRWLRDNRES